MEQYDLTYDNIQEIGERYKGSVVTSFYCKLYKKWINHTYEIIGNTAGNYGLKLQHLDTNSKVHLYEGNKIQICKQLVKGAMSPPLPGPKYCGGGGGGRQ